MMRPKAHEAAVRLDDPTVFRAFYDHVFPQVSGYFHRRCHDRQQADDLTQETFLAAVRRIRAGDDVDEPRAWIFGIARHKLVDHYRHEAAGRRAAGLVRAATPRGPDEWRPPSEPLTEAQRTLAVLPADQRAALVLHHVDDLPVAEVARILGRSPGAVESLLVRGREAFRASYREVSDVG